MAKAKDPTHVVVKDVITSETGRVKAGDTCQQADFDAGTWTNLTQRGLVRSIAELEAEADAKDETQTSPTAGDKKEGA